MTSNDSFIIFRWSPGSMPIFSASCTRAPGPTPNIARPRVIWSSCTMRSASMNGLWYGNDTTPVPSRICRVRCAAAAMNISGQAINSKPPE